MLISAIDHLVVTAPTLASGVEYVEQTLGCKMQTGGQHSRMGTHNALLKLSNNSYLEVIAIDPAGEPPGRSRWFELDRLLPESRPRLATWVMRTNDIHKVANSTSLATGVVEEMNRGMLEWQITIPTDGRLLLRGIAPAVIQWKDKIHPASKLAASGVSLLKLVGHHPEARHISAFLESAHFEGPFSVIEPQDGVTVRLTATFMTPKGLVVMS